MWYFYPISHTEPSSHTSYTVSLAARGRLVLPAPVRKALDLHEEDPLIVTLEGPGSVRLTSARQAAKQGRGILKGQSGGRHLADEMLRERRDG